MTTSTWVAGVNKPPVGTKVLVPTSGGWRRGTVTSHIYGRPWVVTVRLEYCGSVSRYDSRQLLDGWELPTTNAFGGWAPDEFDQ